MIRVKLIVDGVEKIFEIENPQGLTEVFSEILSRAEAEYLRPLFGDVPLKEIEIKVKFD